jgi:phosphoglucosamine mutase
VERKYFGTDGIRGQVGKGYITPKFMLKLGWAAGRVLGNGAGSKVLIGKDTRISGYLFESALEAGLVAAGVNIRLLGPMPTPGIAYLTRTLHACAGIVISASHNPHCDNGIKFFSADGDKLPDEVEQRIEEEFDRPMTTVGSEQLGKAKRVDDARGRYIEFCKSTIPSTISLKGMKIAIDCANGATYHVAPHVLDELGAEVVKIGCEPDGLNINDGVGATSPEALSRKVIETNADLGLALDGDGDRLIMVDAKGNLIDGDAVLYIIARSRLHGGVLTGPVVGTVMSNLGLEHALQRLGIPFERTQVGDRYILERLKATGGVLGGEPSGHVICRDRTTTGDGIVSALQILAEMVKTGKRLSALLDDLETYPQCLVNVTLPRKVDVLSEPAVRHCVQLAERELGGSGRVLLRPSGTEPLLRVMVEGQDADQVESIAHRLADAVRVQVKTVAETEH